MTSDLSYRDLRSPSVPHLRFRTQRAKYGGPLPTSTGLPHSAADPGMAFHPPTGSFVSCPRHLAPRAPTEHLTQAQLYRVAQNNVLTLVGKRVNRHNQRTGERDPWNWYGPGRRWSKAVASGEAESRDWRERRADTILDEWCGSELCESCMSRLVDEDGDSAVAVDEVWGPKYGSDGERLRFVAGGRMGRRRRSVGDWRVVRKEDAEARWTELNSEQYGEVERDRDGWEIVSVNSSPA